MLALLVKYVNYMDLVPFKEESFDKAPAILKVLERQDLCDPSTLRLRT